MICDGYAFSEAYYNSKTLFFSNVLYDSLIFFECFFCVRRKAVGVKGYVAGERR